MAPYIWAPRDTGSPPGCLSHGDAIHSFVVDAERWRENASTRRPRERCSSGLGARGQLLLDELTVDPVPRLSQQRAQHVALHVRDEDRLPLANERRIVQPPHDVPRALPRQRMAVVPEHLSHRLCHRCVRRERLRTGAHALTLPNHHHQRGRELVGHVLVVEERVLPLREQHVGELVEECENQRIGGLETGHPKF